MKRIQRKNQQIYLTSNYYVKRYYSENINMFFEKLKKFLTTKNYGLLIKEYNTPVLDISPGNNSKIIQTIKTEIIKQSNSTRNAFFRFILLYNSKNNCTWEIIYRNDKIDKDYIFIQNIHSQKTAFKMEPASPELDTKCNFLLKTGYNCLTDTDKEDLNEFKKTIKKNMLLSKLTDNKIKTEFYQEILNDLAYKFDY